MGNKTISVKEWYTLWNVVQAVRDIRNHAPELMTPELLLALARVDALKESNNAKH